MSWLFGKKKKPAAPTPQEQSENISKTIEDLRKKEEYYDKQILMEEKKAREFMKKGNKKRAMECMKRKKLIEKSRDNMSAMAFNLEQQKMKIQEVQTTANVFATYRQNAETMKQQFGNVDIDKIDDVLADYEDMQADMDEITSAMTRTIGPEMDEDELDDELAALMNEGEETTLDTTTETPQTMQADEDEGQIEQLMGGFA
ncbi:Charged multivesicular body protein 4a [Histomonas meleagridis]|uniref:Charged multivesicular body protein 4a n=1 Tax=Histomonas meleagridis TaxID=135588 RepID=UPI003559C9CE|nr:Charged multivesicular body protein 4a [Histomonas meleagridis]KAH0797056.1 Charged multivesicular body protein 4a [Histomonas meleagridis]